MEAATGPQAHQLRRVRNQPVQQIQGQQPQAPQRNARHSRPSQQARRPPPVQEPHQEPRTSAAAEAAECERRRQSSRSTLDRVIVVVGVVDVQGRRRIGSRCAAAAGKRNSGRGRLEYELVGRGFVDFVVLRTQRE